MKAHVFALCLSLSLCLGLPLPALAFASPFTDVQETSPYYDAILWAAETGVTNGTTASSFSPDAPCTRAQLAVFLWRAAGEPKPALAEQQFMDVTDPSAYYYGAVQWAAEKDMWGFGTFCAPCGVYPAGRGILPVARRRQPGYGGRISLCRRPLRGRRRTRTAPLPVC